MCLICTRITGKIRMVELRQQVVLRYTDVAMTKERIKSQETDHEL